MTVSSFEFAVFEGVKAVHKASNLLSPKFAQLGIGTVVLTDVSGSLDLGGAQLANSSLAAGLIVIGNASNVGTAQALSGDATLTSAGVLTISGAAVTTSKIADGSITKAKLDDSVAGLGLHRNGATQQIDINPDGSTLTITNGVLQVQQSGIDTAHLATAAVTVQKLSPGLQAEIGDHETRITNLEAQITLLTSAVAAIQANIPKQFTATSTAGQTSIAVTGFTFDPSNTVLDIDVTIDGRVQTQDTAGGATQSYFKADASTLTLSEALAAGKSVRVFKRGTSSGPSITQVIGSADLTNIAVPVAPITNGAETLGQPQKAWASLYLKDSGSSQVYQLIFTNGGLLLNPV